MQKDPFAAAVEKVPEEQRRLLNEMGSLGLLKSYGWNDLTGRWAIQYTPAGRDFLSTVKAVAAPEPEARLARLLALEALAEGAVIEGTFE